LYYVWNRTNSKSTGSDHHLAYKRYYNLVFVLSRSNLGLTPAPHWATILYLEPSTSASSAASDQLYFVWNRSKGKSTGADHHLAYKRYYNLVYLLRRSNLGVSPAPHWATILYLAPSTSAPSAASDHLYFVWNRSKGKSTVSDRHLSYNQYYNLVLY
jgi:hypothetical protein